MSNWFENNPTKTVIGHTFVVAAATWAAFFFVFDENKVKLVETRAEKYQAETKEVLARNSVLLAQRDLLLEENKKYLRWLESTPKTLPFYEIELEKLNNKVESLEAKLREAEKHSNNTEKPINPEEAVYVYQQTLNAGETFIDPKTQVVLGVQKIEYELTAQTNISFPDGSGKSSSHSKPGDSWRFSVGESKYVLVIQTLDWVAQRFTGRVHEVK
ncbi:hypothetical protein [Marinomonas mediterranea]|uniref:hypothetical protein n=1 Tax=Marinomonas mediterranea TaxID=119864 RepID=UPI00234A4494|nr:hypothetical protein [Marinomonas mediterranea]WCN11009.1 hypothetical protein GV055_19770 [Marinomonas mediterranea]